MVREPHALLGVYILRDNPVEIDMSKNRNNRPITEEPETAEEEISPGVSGEDTAIGEDTSFRQEYGEDSVPTDEDGGVHHEPADDLLIHTDTSAAASEDVGEIRFEEDPDFVTLEEIDDHTIAIQEVEPAPETLEGSMIRPHLDTVVHEERELIRDRFTGAVKDPEDGKTVWAPPGSYDAAAAGIQQDASGHFESAKAVRSTASGTRV